MSGSPAISMNIGQDEYVGFLNARCTLAPDAQPIIESAIACQQNKPDLAYTDHKNSIPVFKPDWSPETLLSHNYIGDTFFVKKTLLQCLGGLRREYGTAQEYDLLLRIAEHTENVLHIPKILYSIPTAWNDVEGKKRAVENAMQRRRARGSVSTNSFGTVSFRFDPNDFLERVTIIIPTLDRVDLLQPCIKSIRAHTLYPNIEILIVNNGSRETRTARFLRQKRLKVIDVKTNGFNFSQLINTAVRAAETPFVLFMNNDTEVVSDGWLLQMMGTILLDDRIGAVGAKLLFPDGQTQHAGIILGPNDCTAGHMNKHLPGTDSGYQNSNRALRNCAAVTAACMLTRKDCFEEVGGFNETHLPISYNDVDYCLKLLAHGYRVVTAPDAVLFHREAATRGENNDFEAEYGARTHLRRAWGPLLNKDPYYNPNLSRKDGCFCVRTHSHNASILFFTHNFEIEGASLSLFELARALKQRQYDIAIFSPKDGLLGTRYMEERIPIHVGTNVNRDAFDILFLNTITNAPLLNNEDIAAHPTILCIRESERDCYSRELSGFSPDLLLKASKILFVSDATRKVYEDIDRGHFTTIHNGIDVKEVDTFASRYDKRAMRMQMGIADTDTVMTSIGTICPRKGQKTIIDAATALLHRLKTPLTFLLVGGGTGSPYEGELRETIHARGLQDRIRIIETTPDIHRYYAVSDIFVCTSLIESLPRVILEAMAWQLPIVATDVFGIPEQIANEREGLLITPENPELLANALMRLITDKPLAGRLAQNAREKVERDFSIDRMTDRYEQLFQELHSPDVTTRRETAATTTGRWN